MKSKLALLILGLGVVCLTSGLGGGCGESRYTVTSYYYPDWTQDGKIICTKKVETYSRGGGMWPALGGGATLVSTNYYITTMSEEGTQEANIKEISRIGKVAASPLGNYIMYTDGNYIKVVTSSGAGVSSIDCGSEIYSFDWSPDEAKLVYNGTKEASVIDLDGSNRKTIAANGASVSWRYGDKIVVDNPISTEVFRVVVLSSPDYSEIAQYSKVQGGEFNISRVCTDEVVYRSAYEKGIKRFYLSSPEADPILLINRNDIWNIHLSPNGGENVGTGDGAGSDFGKEIWTMNIDGSLQEQIR
jgi:hypothetical protein